MLDDGFRTEVAEFLDGYVSQVFPFDFSSFEKSVVAPQIKTTGDQSKCDTSI